MQREFAPAGSYTINLGKTFQQPDHHGNTQLYTLRFSSPIEEENLPARRVAMYDENDTRHMEWSPLQAGGAVSSYEAVPGTNQDVECLLIYDEETQTFVLERQTMRYTMKKTLKRRFNDQTSRDSTSKPEKVTTPRDTLALPPRHTSQASKTPTIATTTTTTTTTITTPTMTMTMTPTAVEESISDDFDLDISKDMDEILGDEDDDDDDDNDKEEGEIVNASKNTKRKSVEDIFEEVTLPTYRPAIHSGSSSVPPPTHTTPLALPPVSSSSSSTSSPALHTSSNGVKRRKRPEMASAPIRHIKPPANTSSPHVHSTSLTVSPAAAPLSPALAVPTLRVSTPVTQQQSSRRPASPSSGDESSSGSSSGSSGSSSSSGSDNDSDSSSGSSSDGDDDDDDDFDTLAENISRSLSKEAPPIAAASLSPQADASSPARMRRSPLENHARNTPTPSRGSGGGGPMSLRALFHEEDEEEEDLSGSSSGSD